MPTRGIGARVLVVDDTPCGRETVTALLEQAGYAVRTAADGFQAERLLDEFVPDVVILELLIPHLSGTELLRRWRARPVDAAVIVLTSSNNAETAATALDAGADDCIAKPLHPREFIARIAAVLRRTRGQSLTGSEIVAGPVRLDLAAQTVSIAGRTAPVSPTELALLRILMGAPGRVFPADELLTRVWGPQYRGEVATLRTSIYRLRRKLAGVNCVRTRQHAGYVFCDEPQEGSTHGGQPPGG